MKDVVTLFEIVSPQILLNFNDEDLKSKPDEIVTIYSTDISKSLLVELHLLRETLKCEQDKATTVRDLAQQLFISHSELRIIFPYVRTLLKIFLTLPVTVASAERSFSKLKLRTSFVRQ